MVGRKDYPCTFIIWCQNSLLPPPLFPNPLHPTLESSHSIWQYLFTNCLELILLCPQACSPLSSALISLLECLAFSSRLLFSTKWFPTKRKQTKQTKNRQNKCGGSQIFPYCCICWKLLILASILRAVCRGCHNLKQPPESPNTNIFLTLLILLPIVNSWSLSCRGIKEVTIVIISLTLMISFNLHKYR